MYANQLIWAIIRVTIITTNHNKSLHLPFVRSIALQKRIKPFESFHSLLNRQAFPLLSCCVNSVTVLLKLTDELMQIDCNLSCLQIDYLLIYDSCKLSPCQFNIDAMIKYLNLNIQVSNLILYCAQDLNENFLFTIYLIIIRNNPLLPWSHNIIRHLN